jgi:hypothetical protein
MSMYLSVYKSYCTRPGRVCNCMSTRASAILVHVVMVAFRFHVKAVYMMQLHISADHLEKVIQRGIIKRDCS